MDWLFDPLNYDFMRQALLAGVLIGILCPVVGTYLIVQRMALLGDVVAHAVLPGLAIANFLTIPLLLGAFISGIISTFVTTWIQAQSKVKVDTAMAITFSSFFALGITLLTILRSRIGLEGLLFGDILSISMGDVWQIGWITVIILVAVKIFYKELLFFTFDPLGAEASGLPVTRINVGLMTLITLAIVAGMKAVGVILVMALMISPAAAASLLTTELHWMMMVGSGLGVISSLVGMYVSYYLDIPSGPAITLTLFSCFLLTLLFSPSQGILTHRFWVSKRQNNTLN
ncbi:metal ABC transporter permease [Leptolyngbyaceae cyanobacterium CCMR0082]|uniref:Metal ABC transporter permease n=2 Tax=Adonisia turfae TaxID=2950184 RepID=A0A6M0S764_9CYAN|nr:metal ABC transporter permease [Adonisia turfae]MDV3349496.1 metal ABC transporter permease [Leptothoe sp. LEGE 181152]NEZ57676.1 metal ABC transporter permease [Adonisia turfae CCMR0081]NEZ64299.1 metal ABC transporter permease [Adonisia turfae CCMR0082]